MRIISLEEAQAMIGEIIAEKGENFVYDKGVNEFCSYFHGDQPGCIVGHLAAKLGAEPGSLPEGHGATYALRSMPDIAFTGQAQEYLSDLQDCQDTGRTWGESDRMAKRRVSAL